jgi:hypothetical protein
MRKPSMSRPVPVNSTTKIRRLPSKLGPVRVEVTLPSAGVSFGCLFHRMR